MSPRRRIPNEGRWMVLAVVTAVVLNWVPAVLWLGFPFRMLTTLVHEMAHGLAALGTGGGLERFVIHPDGSGVAYTVGGVRVVVIAAGYLGAAAFAALMITSGASRVGGRVMLGGVGSGLVVLTLLYGTPSLFAEALGSALLTLGWGVALGVAFVALALWARLQWVAFIVWLTAIQVGLSALSDLWVLVYLSTDPRRPLTDAQAMAALTVLPALFWAVFWALISLAMLGGAMVLTWKRSAR